MKSIITDMTAPRQSEGTRANGPNQHAIPPSDHIDARSLGINSPEVHPVPDDADIVVFSATADFYANYDAAAAIPGDTVDGIASELNPVQRDVRGLSTIGLIAPASCVITMSFYSYPDNPELA